MAQGLDDCEFWLPPQFLTDDDILMDFKPVNLNGKNAGSNAGSFFPFDYPSGFGSFGPSSEQGSSLSSTETESDEEDYLAELTRKMAHSTLQDDFCDAQKVWPMAGSPQSTLCGVLGGCGCKQGSSRGSPNCVSPPPAPFPADRQDGAWDLLHAAAGEVARMKLMEDSVAFAQNRGLLGPPGKQNPNSNIGFHSNQALSYRQLQVAQFQQLKQQQMMKQQGSAIWGQAKPVGLYQQNQTHQMVQNRARNNGRPLGLSQSAWPTLQQSQQQQPPNSTGMRAVFLGNAGAKKECAGTGVFLPRRLSSSTEARKKPACSTVLLPDRVVQALKLNLEAMDAQSQVQTRYSGTFSFDYDAASRHRNNVALSQKRNVRPQPAMNPEFRLPQEWTY
ncbi:uncharacterized protein LOC127791235 [Diospyros lotus]|uniref:uncharacterized protein LOC127791235 n=1 Tax=Diospyros lotus TaxID=55363 RepID=UPI002257893A|nr:uncharacterized protein LOC127791235 [Diospyros lotus]